MSSSFVKSSFVRRTVKTVVNPSNTTPNNTNNNTSNPSALNTPTDSIPSMPSSNTPSSTPLSSSSSSSSSLSALSSIMGVRSWLHGIHLLSSGHPAMDSILQGGLPLHSLLLCTDDSYSPFSSTFLRLYIADTLSYRQHLAIIHPYTDDEYQKLLSLLPRNRTLDQKKTVDGQTIKEEDEDGDDNNSQSSTPPPSSSSSRRSQEGHIVSSSAQSAAASHGLHIAWRYGAYMNKPVSRGTQFSYDYDFSRSLSKDIKDNAPTITDFSIKNIFGSEKEKTFSNYLKSLFIKIYQFLQSNHCIRSSSTPSVARIVMPNFLDSRYTFFDSHSVRDTVALSQFFHAIRSIARSFLCQFFFTMPSSSLKSFQSSSIDISDYFDLIWNVQSFAGTRYAAASASSTAAALASMAAYHGYDGVLQIVKYSKMNSLIGFSPSERYYLFKLERKSFKIEKLALPPELSRTEEKTNTASHDAKKNTTNKGQQRSMAGCSGGYELPHGLDF